MANVDNFIFYKSWYDKVVKATTDVDLQKEMIWRIVKYGAIEDLVLFEGDNDGFKNMVLQDIAETIERDKIKYAEKVELGKTVGRQQSFDREELKALIAAGRKGKDIAGILGVTEAAIYHDEVWKNRKMYNNYR